MVGGKVGNPWQNFKHEKCCDYSVRADSKPTLCIIIIVTHSIESLNNSLLHRVINHVSLLSFRMDIDLVEGWLVTPDYKVRNM
jgi:hypothetical protein